MLVTKLDSSTKGRVNVYTDEEFAFVLYKGELSTYGIEEGTEISETTYEEILRKTLLPRCKKRAMNLLMPRDYSVSEMKKKLSEGGYPNTVIEDTVSFLLSFHYLDDHRYAVNFVHSKMNSSPIRIIRHKLSEKGISDELQEEAIAEVYEQDREIQSVQKVDYISPEEDMLRRKMAARLSTNAELSYEERMKLFASFYRKGFSMDMIENVYKDLT